MKQDVISLAKINPHLDLKVVKDFERLASQVPLTGVLRKGSNYTLSHPLETSIAFVQPKRQKVSRTQKINR